jgi:hypothetical protein
MLTPGGTNELVVGHDRPAPMANTLAKKSSWKPEPGMKVRRELHACMHAFCTATLFIAHQDRSFSSSQLSTHARMPHPREPQRLFLECPFPSVSDLLSSFCQPNPKFLAYEAACDAILQKGAKAGDGTKYPLFPEELAPKGLKGSELALFVEQALVKPVDRTSLDEESLWDGDGGSVVHVTVTQLPADIPAGEYQPRFIIEARCERAGQDQRANWCGTIADVCAPERRLNIDHEVRGNMHFMCA